jgi:DNA-binding LytR/AlgR family response regulator
VRVHRSFIVAIHKIEAIQKHRIIIGKERIPIGENHKAEFYSIMDKNNL